MKTITQTTIKPMIVYLLHFHQKLAHSQHYIGFTTNLDKRLTDHLCGMGARLMEVCFERGIEWRLVRTWPGDRELERRLKRRHGAASICPICNPATAMNRAVFTTKGGARPMTRNKHLAIEIFELILSGDERDKKHAANLIQKLNAEGRRDLRAAIQRLDYLLDDVFLSEQREKRIERNHVAQ